MALGIPVLAGMPAIAIKGGYRTNGPDTAQHRSNNSLSTTGVGGIGEFILIVERIRAQGLLSIGKHVIQP